MRKREVVWQDPRFRKKKDQPKALKINKYGEAPCELPPAHVPAYATASIPSGLTAPPCPRPAAAAAPAGRGGGPGRAAVCRRPPPEMSKAPPPRGYKPRAPTVAPPRPSAVNPPVVVATRAPPLAPHGGARPKQMMYRPGTAVPQRPMTARVPPSASPCPPRTPMYSRPSPCPPSPCPTPRPPSPCPTPRRTSPCPTPCPPSPCPAPCPPTPCAAPCPASPPQRQPSPPCPRQTRFSGLPRRGGLRPPMAGRSGLRPPTATYATPVVARRASPVPCPPEPCLPEPCPPEPCPPEPCPPEPCPNTSMAPCPPQVSTPLPRRPSAFQGGLRPPSRLMGPGSFSRPQPKPQKIVLLPGDINPHETTVITVEPPPQPEPCRPRSPEACMPWQNMVTSVPFDFSPPSMDAFRRDSGHGVPPLPYIPPEILAMAEEAQTCPESPSDSEMPQFETSSALLVDIEPLDPCSVEPRVLIEPVDLITFPAPDPFSPPRICRPQSPSVTPPPNPFTPPKDPIPEPSELDKWAAQYPRYPEAYTSSFHPVSEWAKLKYQQKSEDQERELVARSVPFNKNVSAICKDDDDYDDEDLGILHHMPDLDDTIFDCPLDYAGIRRQEEILRQESEARRLERERQAKGPSLAETTELLERIRAAENARRTEMARNVMINTQPAFLTQEQMREIHDRVMARHAGTEVQQEQPSDTSCLDRGPCDMLVDIDMDECDLDAIDYMDDCLDF
ncbi:unnamed protein product [Nezara viridula]|uniref:Uncharacterized protein n=1 Tax=Nezara viridula TaxID=85310 RepID=A0A9P0MRN3_NEZVI|nr:unnamed protein product [Nezara viridula]